jgi:hypothetical protein
MLIDWHQFQFVASVPWPKGSTDQLDWVNGIACLEHWLNVNVGSHYMRWAWHDSQLSYSVGVAFKWDRDRSLFVLTWA